MQAWSLGGRRRSPSARRGIEGVAVLSALVLGAELGGVPAAVAAPEADAPAAAEIGFDEVPSLLAIVPGDGAANAELDGVIQLTFDAP
ncbi:MAG TPA: hypothetical protein VMG12_43160, partial [Polyangiaceae bacterium]|nr:hypothetical protein [Polyangiaceae bacterium]